MIKAGLLALASLAVLAFVACEGDDPLSSSSVTSLPTSVSATAAPAPATDLGSLDPSGPPAFTIDVNNEYTAVIVTDNGDIHIKLFPAEVPNTVNNFVHLATTGFYDGVTFHRVIPGFMAQTGDPTGTGMGGPGYTFENEFDPEYKHDSAGILSMANAGTRNGQATNGSQFFITHGPTPHLDGMHTVFGKVTQGLEIVVNLRERDPQSATANGVKIITIEIIEE